MDRAVFDLVAIADVIVVGGLMLLYPRIARRGLLFGVYVGEERSTGPEARELVRGWNRGVLLAFVASLALAAALAAFRIHPLFTVLPTLVLGAASAALYLRFYRRARAIAPAAPSSLAAAPIVADGSPGAFLPVTVLSAGAICGLFAIAYTAAHFDALPDRMPTHFGTSGAPDGWSKKGFASVMIMPIMTLVMGVLLGGATFLTSRAKRAVRLDDAGASLDAQNRFRAAMTRFLAALAVLVTALLTTMSIAAVQVALGRRDRLPPSVLVLGVGVGVIGMVGALWLAIRYGQGGSRLEGRAAEAPLTNGLADNSSWRLGVFYVNPQDPSWLVEHRFGFGYTLNFGNRRAVATVAVLFGSMIALGVWAVAAL